MVLFLIILIWNISYNVGYLDQTGQKGSTILARFFIKGANQGKFDIFRLSTMEKGWTKKLAFLL